VGVCDGGGEGGGVHGCGDGGGEEMSPV
jgi:hypothetical protein